MSTPFSLIQAGSHLDAMNPDGSAQVEITLPSGVTISATDRVRVAILNRKIIVAGSPGISEPIWIRPLTLDAFKLRIAAPTAPVLTGGASTGPFYGWVSFIQKIGSEVVNESPLSPSSIQSTSAIFTSIAIPPGGSPVTGRRLYRSVKNGTIPFPAVDIDDIVTTTFDTNSITDASLQLLPGDPDLGLAPSDLDLIVAWRDRLWGRSATDGQQDNAYFTEVAEYWAWRPDNFLLAQPGGEDFFGITGFIPRRDELGICKRSRILKVIGTGVDADFDVIVVADGIGCVSPDSIAVIRDIGYFLGLDGPYTFGPQGVQSIVDKRVSPWFQTDTFFNRAMFHAAVGGYNPINGTYDLHLASAGSSVLDRWVSYDIKRDEWIGPSKTDKFTPSARGLLRDANSQFLPAIGSTDGWVYMMNQGGASDQGVGIAIDWISAFLSGNAPDIYHRWLEGAILIAIQAGSTAPLVITPRVGDLDATDGTAINVSQLVDRTRLPRFGTGRLLRLQLTHSQNGEDVLLYALEIPFNETGRR